MSFAEIPKDLNFSFFVLAVIIFCFSLIGLVTYWHNKLKENLKEIDGGDNKRDRERGGDT